MSYLGNIKNSYGSTFSAAIANANANAVMQSSGLPKNTVIIASEYDVESMTDIGNQSILITDSFGNPVHVSSKIAEKNGIHVDSENSNLLSLNIDNSTLKFDDRLYVSQESIVNGTSMNYENNSINIDCSRLAKASVSQFGVAKVDGLTVKSDNGTIYVDTDALDLANDSVDGIVKPDGITLQATDGAIRANSQNIDKASESRYGVCKADNVTLVSDSGILSVGDMSNYSSNGLGMYHADGITLSEQGNVLSVNQQAIRHATASSAGTVKIDSQTLDVDSDGILHVKKYDESFAYVYDLKEGMTELESKISYVKNLLNTNQYGSTEPEIQHVTCNQTTTSILAKPTHLEEPINMQIQHVYVSLSVITNCEFILDIDYFDNEIPNVELNNVNYNDEFSVKGVTAHEYIYPSTELKEKNIVLLFNSKNFYSTTGPRTKTTKISISVVAKDDNTKFKKTTYSIIRYNSFYNDDEQQNVEEESIEYSADYIVDERSSKWFYVELKTDQTPNGYDRNDTFDENSEQYIKNSGCIAESQNQSTIKINILSQWKEEGTTEELPEIHAMFFKGVYIKRSTGESFSFITELEKRFFNYRLNVSQDNDSLYGRGAYDYAYKVEFDTLYFQIRYQIDKNPRIVSKKSWIDTYQYHPSKDSESFDLSLRVHIPNENDRANHKELLYDENGWTETQFDDHENIEYITNSILQIGDELMNASKRDNDNAVIFAKDNKKYVEITYESNDDTYTNVNVNTYLSCYNMQYANIYFISPKEKVSENSTVEQLETFVRNSIAEKIHISNHLYQYDAFAYAYPYFSDEKEYITYGDVADSLRLHLEHRYVENEIEKTAILTSSNVEQYSNILLPLEVSYNNVNVGLHIKNNEVILAENITMENLEYDGYDGTMTFEIAYNFRYGNENDNSYFDENMTYQNSVHVYSNPKLNVEGLSYENGYLMLSELECGISGVQEIDDVDVKNDNINTFFNSILVSYFSSYDSQFSVERIELEAGTFEFPYSDVEIFAAYSTVNVNELEISYMWSLDGISNDISTFSIMNFKNAFDEEQEGEDDGSNETGGGENDPQYQYRFAIMSSDGDEQTVTLKPQPYEPLKLWYVSSYSF